MSPTLKFDGLYPKLEVAINMAVLHVALQLEQSYRQLNSHCKHGYMLENFM